MSYLLKKEIIQRQIKLNILLDLFNPSIFYKVKTWLMINDIYSRYKSDKIFIMNQQNFYEISDILGNLFQIEIEGKIDSRIHLFNDVYKYGVQFNDEIITKICTFNNKRIWFFKQNDIFQIMIFFNFSLRIGVKYKFLLGLSSSDFEYGFYGLDVISATPI